MSVHQGERDVYTVGHQKNVPLANQSLRLTIITITIIIIIIISLHLIFIFVQKKLISLLQF